jgi:hypothetical protein
MARSSYIYLVTQKGSGVPVAAFTVKRELGSWLWEQDMSRYRAFRMKDGNPVKVERVDGSHWEVVPVHPIELDLTTLKELK